jgi:hypothetical protein
MNMKKYALVYGGLSGLAIVLVICAGLIFAPGSLLTSVWMGYLIMLIALTLIFIGMKRYRDVEKGGVIKFLPALGMGLATAMVSALVYVAVWEVYLAFTNYTFFDQYIAATQAKMQAEGVAADMIARQVAEMESYRPLYANPLARMAITFTEIAPVGLIVAFVSAALLRNPRLLPAKREVK